MNKKGIAPFVATLLLLSFAIALGVVVMTFGKAQIELEAQCPIDIGLHFTGVSSCYNENTNDLSFNIQNGVNVKVEGVVVNIIGTEKAQTFELNEAKMSRAGSYLGNLAFESATASQIRQVKISPKIILKGAEQICPEKGLILDSVLPC